MTFLLAGHETTAVLLTWTTYLLTKHPEYCERAREEVSGVGGLFALSFLFWKANHLSLAEDLTVTCLLVGEYPSWALITRLQ